MTFYNNAPDLDLEYRFDILLAEVGVSWLKITNVGRFSDPCHKRPRVSERARVQNPGCCGYGRGSFVPFLLSVLRLFADRLPQLHRTNIEPHPLHVNFDIHGYVCDRCGPVKSLVVLRSWSPALFQ
jgi:hypothetical protein